VSTLQQPAACGITVNRAVWPDTSPLGPTMANWAVLDHAGGGFELTPSWFKAEKCYMKEANQ
jgi:hypothetical protein